jgi:cysteine desulfurase
MIYLDYQATTPLAPEAFEAMLPWLKDGYANPHSAHSAGRAAKAAIEVAREQVLQFMVPPDLGPRPDTAGIPDATATVIDHIEGEIASRRAHGPADGKIYFTSGATEAANWAIKGTFDRRASGRNKIVTVTTEHACVLDTVTALAPLGAEVTLLPVDREGRVDREAAVAAIDDRTALVAIMLVNNEIGTVQSVQFLGSLAQSKGAVLFCDAVQGAGRVQMPLWSCDLVAVSAHKIYGPKGIGALWVRDGYAPAPLLFGGGQEGGIRSGTLSPALCVGFGVAANLMRTQGNGDLTRLWALARDRLRGPAWLLNGDRVHRYRGNLNVRRDGLDVARLMSDCRDIAFSAGSACASGSGRSSHVLRAIGLTEAQARSSIRLGFGRYTTEQDLTTAIDRILAAADAQRLAA